jgi:hypothetical protein
MARGPAYHGRTHGVTDDGAGTYVNIGTDPITGLADALNAGGGGIQFGIENDGNWLDVRTDATGPSSYGIYLNAAVGSIVNQGISLQSDGIISLASNHLQLGANVEIDVTPTIVTVGMSNQALFPREIRLQLGNTTASPQGSKVVIYDAAGTSIFEVRDDGTFHIKTGATWADDL